MNEIYKSNIDYWRRENARDHSNGMLLYENIDDTPQLCYGISKIALSIAKSLNLTPAVIMPWRKSEMTESMCDKQFKIKDALPFLLFKHFLEMMYVLFVMDRRKLLDYHIGNDKIGKYIYDTMLRREKKKTIIKLSLKERAYICLELCYYHYFCKIIRNNPIKVIVLGDCVYRYGLLYELCMNNNITCYSPINMNTVFLRKQLERRDFNSDYLNKEILDNLCSEVDYKLFIDEYYSKRYSGNVQQHDVLSAYANKVVTSNDDFIIKYNLDPNKKTIIVTSHVFADAPHVYSNSLYDDYWEWFVCTCNCLLNNKNINLLVKEHPSAYLYGEKGVVTEFLREKGLEHIQIKEDESTLSVLRSVDAVVTCGGTVGMEIAYFGKYVVLASRPPYSGLGFSKEFSSKAEYEDFLTNQIHQIGKLNQDQYQMALKASYALFCRANNWTPNLELGGEIIYMGKKYNNEGFEKNIIKYNEKPLCEQDIYKLLDEFVHSDKKCLFSKL